MAKTKPTTAVHVPTGLNVKTRFFGATAGFWRRLAAIESGALRDELEAIRITKPLYVTGVPRAGTTITTELLERHPTVTSHRYSDFPNVYTPYWRNWLADRTGRGRAEAIERAHGDRIMVTPESPEAVEEVIWMQFFDQLHDPAVDQVLDKEVDNPDFEAFYRDHLRKLLLVRGASRYLAKGNYNITRLRYLAKLFPDARFVVVVRNPVNHVASLIKQDRRFHAASREDRRVPGQMASSGHFEFGPQQRAINVGDPATAEAIQEGWRAGRLPEAWARYWASAYGFLLDQMERDPELRKAVSIIYYESLCREPERVIRDLLQHCELGAAPFEETITEYSNRISEPTYYEPDFSKAELESIQELCMPTARRLGFAL